MILLIILILLLIGALPTWPYSTGWGYYPSGGLGLVLIIVLILLLMGRFLTPGNDIAQYSVAVWKTGDRQIIPAHDSSNDSKKSTIVRASKMPKWGRCGSGDARSDDSC